MLLKSRNDSYWQSLFYNKNANTVHVSIPFFIIHTQRRGWFSSFDLLKSNSKDLNRGVVGFLGGFGWFSALFKAKICWKFLLFTTHEANTCHCRFCYTLEVVQLDLEVKESWPWHMLNSQQVVWRGYGRIGKLIPHTHSSNCRMLIIDVLCADFSNSLGVDSLKGVEEASLLQSHLKTVSDLNFI